MIESKYSRAVRKFKNRLFYSRGSRMITHGVWRIFAAVAVWAGLILLVVGGILWLRFHFSAGAADADAQERFKKVELMLIGGCVLVLGIAMRKMQVASGREPERGGSRGKSRAVVPTGSKPARE